MNEEMSKVLVELAEKTLSGVDAVTAFSAEQIPDVLQQVLVWHASQAVVGIVMFCCLFSIALKVWLRIYTGLKNNEDWCYVRYEYLKDDPAVFTFPVLGGSSVVLFISAGRVFENLLVLIKIAVAPKLFILEYAAGLVI